MSQNIIHSQENQENKNIFIDLLNAIHERVERIEKGSLLLQKNLELLSTIVCNSNIKAPVKRVRSRLFLRLQSEFISLWYTDKNLPPFTVYVVDENEKIFTEANNWEIEVLLIDGHGKYLSDKLEFKDNKSTKFIISRGVAVVSGLQFSQVSSKNGGCFILEFRIVNSVDSSKVIVPDSVRSKNITVLSGKLYNSPKSIINQLKPEDSVSRIPGISRYYAQRFSMFGIQTINQLSQLSLEDMSPLNRQHFMENLRKEKNSMTIGKLNEYIDQAKEIVSCSTKKNLSHQSVSEDLYQSPTKRLKISAGSTQEEKETNDFVSGLVELPDRSTIFPQNYNISFIQDFNYDTSDAANDLKLILRSASGRFSWNEAFLVDCFDH